MADEWDYSSEYCDGCAELGLTTCSCEPDGLEEECENCGDGETYSDGLCESCYDFIYETEEEE